MLMHWLMGIAALALAPAMMGSAMDEQDKDIAPARDGNIAIEEELHAARRARTLEAYDLFIARHPQHPLAETARRERQQLARERRPR